MPGKPLLHGLARQARLQANADRNREKFLGIVSTYQGFLNAHNLVPSFQMRCLRHVVAPSKRMSTTP